MKILFCKPKRIIKYLLGSLLLPFSFIANATPITIGSLSSNDDGSTQIITDSRHHIEWLRWDQNPGYTYEETVAELGTIAGGGWEIARAVHAQTFVNALLYDPLNHPNPCPPTIAPQYCYPDNWRDTERIYAALTGLTNPDPSPNTAYYTSAFYLTGAGSNLSAGRLSIVHQEQVLISCVIPGCPPDPLYVTIIKDDGWGTIPEADFIQTSTPLWDNPSAWLLHRRVPEPATLLLIGLGIVWLGLTRCKRKHPT